MSTSEGNATTQQNFPNNFFSFLSIIPKFLANPFGFVKNENVKSEKKFDNKKADVVRFPSSQPEVPPLKVENEDAQDTSPFFLWQVYALGGIIVLRWAWGKWQERKANEKKDISGEDQPPATDAVEASAPAPATAPAPAPEVDPTPAED